MRRLLCMAMLGATFLFAGCGSDSDGNDAGTTIVRPDVGTDVCRRSMVTCPDLSRQPYDTCMTMDGASCYYLHGSDRYDCAECGVIGGCLEATESLLENHCP